MEKTFNLTTRTGAWDSNPQFMPRIAGIYFVYRCSWSTDPVTQLKKSYLSKLLYIGESNDMHRRLLEHNEANDIRTSDIPKSEALYYTCAPYEGTEGDRKRIEAALIFRHKDILPKGVGNSANTKSFDYDPTTIVIGGEYTYSLDLNFTQKRDTTG